MKPPKMQLHSFNGQDRHSEDKARQSLQILNKIYRLKIQWESKRQQIFQENSIKQPVNKERKTQHETCNGGGRPNICMNL